MGQSLPDIYIAIPILNEYENLGLLLQNIQAQDYSGCVKVYICVNQPDEWWDDPTKQHICEDNQKSISFLREQTQPDIHLFDRSIKGKGWKGKHHGVGYARREVMQAIAAIADDRDIIVSLDADTTFGPCYLSSLVENLRRYPQVTAISVPYYHKLGDDPAANRAILRYEIYMRTYSINLWRINSPYSFTALGSAIALTVGSYKSIGGITPKMSGEDFYFLQKLRKKGEILCWNLEKVYPAARFSDRVYFGTGPAMIRGAAGDWSSYPIYDYRCFDVLGVTYSLLPSLYIQDVPTPIDEFLSIAFSGENIWQKLRQNSTTSTQFVRACHEKIDGLRVLQYLKWRHRQGNNRDEENLLSFLDKFYPKETVTQLLHRRNLDFESSSIKLLENVRNFLTHQEEIYQNRQVNVPE